MSMRRDEVLLFYCLGEKVQEQTSLQPQPRMEESCREFQTQRQIKAFKILEGTTRYARLLLGPSERFRQNKIFLGNIFPRL